MMHRIIFIFFTAIAFINKANAEDSIVSKLLRLEKSYFSSADEKEKSAIAYEKLKIKLADSRYSDELMNEVERIDPEFLTTESQIIFYWNTSIVYYLKNDFYKSIYYIEKYLESISNKSINALLFYYLLLTKINLEKSKIIHDELIEKVATENNLAQQNDSIFACLSCLSEINQVSLLNKKGKLISSAFIPGSGLIMNGNVLKGIKTTFINGLSATFIYYLIKKENYINALGWGFSMWLKFYSGNLKLTERSIDEKRNRIISKKAQECEKKLARILSIYPINYIGL